MLRAVGTPLAPGAPVEHTARQIEYLRAFVDFYDTHGIPPTNAELAEAMGVGKGYGITRALRALEENGWVRTVIPETPRNRIPTYAGRAVLEAEGMDGQA